GMWSGATPPEGGTAEIVNLSDADPSKIAQLDLKGKLVLVGQNPAGFKWALVKAGAIGAINAFTENPSLQDGRQWINAWGDHGWGFTKGSTPLLSFSISPREGALTRKLLAERGVVRVKATVDSHYYSGTYPYVTGLIRGSGPEEVLTLGHSFEQGAQDNATGVAAMLESLATVNRLIFSGKLPRPKRSIRLLTMGELYGSMYYIEKHPDRIRRTVAALCMDTPAASYDLAGTEYTFYMNPHVAKSYTDAFILRIAEEYFSQVHRPWHEHQSMSGTDTYLSEPMINVPTVWAYSGSGVETHHNSEDTPDRVDSRSLRDVATVNAAYLYSIIWPTRVSPRRCGLRSSAKHEATSRFCSPLRRSWNMSPPQVTLKIWDGCSRMQSITSLILLDGSRKRSSQSLAWSRNRIRKMRQRVSLR